MANEESQLGKNMTLLAIGAAVGAVLGVLFAPKAGKETREELTDWLRDRREKGSDLLGKIREKFPVKKEQLSAALKAGKHAFYEAKHNEKTANSSN